MLGKKAVAYDACGFLVHDISNVENALLHASFLKCLVAHCVQQGISDDSQRQNEYKRKVYQKTATKRNKG